MNDGFVITIDNRVMFVLAMLGFLVACYLAFKAGWWFGEFWRGFTEPVALEVVPGGKSAGEAATVE